MGHRLYDPLTGRMLSADPIVQEPFNLQNLNRYSYVLNNPLSYTDPTGLSFVRKYWRQIVQIAAAVLTAGQSLWVTMATSFTVGVAVTGSLRGGLIAAFSAAVFHGIGGHFAEVAAANRAALGADYAGVLGTGLKAAQFATQIGAHAMAGGVISMMQGGKFGHGFVSAGATKAASPWINSIGDGARELAPARVATAALVGGTVSAATGGKFANGAVTAAFQQAWNAERGQALEDRATAPVMEEVGEWVFSAGASKDSRLSFGGDATTDGPEFEVGGHWKLVGGGVAYSAQGADPFVAFGPGSSAGSRRMLLTLRWYQRQGLALTGQGSVCLPGVACGNAGFEYSNMRPASAARNIRAQVRHVFDMLRPRPYLTPDGRPYISNQYYEERR